MHKHTVQPSQPSTKSFKALNVFLVLSAISAVSIFILNILSHGSILNDMYYGSDYFMDFFNSLCDASTKDVYSERGVIYPPLASILFYLFSKMVPPEYAAFDFESGKRHRFYSQGSSQLLFLIFVIVFVILLAILLYSILQRKLTNIQAIAVSFFLVFSFPTIYCIQRGNITLIALVLSLFFVFFRKSENKVIKELSFIALAIAAGLKIFPALFGLLLLTDKKYKEAIRLAVYGIIAFFLPFAFYGGFAGLTDLLNNIFRFSGMSTQSYSVQGTSISNLLAWFIFLFGIDLGTLIKIAKIVILLCCFFIFAFSDKEWVKLLTICFALANIDSTARIYILIFLIIPFVSFLLSKKSDTINIFYSILFCMLLISIPCYWYFQIDTISEMLNAFVSLDETTLVLFKKANIVISSFVIFIFECSLFISTFKTLITSRRKSI